MKKLIVVPILVICVTGCTSIKSTGPGWTLNTQSFLWDRANVSASVSTNGVTNFHEDTSNPDDQAILGLAQALVTAVASAPK